MEGSRPTSNVEAGARQDVALVVVADQVVAGRLPGGVEPRQRHAQVGRAQHPVQRAGQRLTVERPEQRAGVDAEVRVDPAAGCQVGAHVQDGVLGVDYGHVWRRGGAEGGGQAAGETGSTKSRSNTASWSFNSPLSFPRNLENAFQKSESAPGGRDRFECSQPERAPTVKQ